MDMKLWETPLDPGLLTTLVREFRNELPVGEEKGVGRIIVVGGFPGSGKTSAGQMFRRLTRATHVQANDARVILTRHGMGWAENVPQIIGEVVGYVLDAKQDVIVDGGISHWPVRLNLETIANRHGGRIFYTFVDCATSVAKNRARLRYQDGEPSKFGDWRAKPYRFETGDKENPGYIEAIDPLAIGMRDQTGIPGLIRIDNNGSISDLSSNVGLTLMLIEQMCQTIR